MEHACLLKDYDLRILKSNLLMFLPKMPPMIESSAMKFLKEKFSYFEVFYLISERFFYTTSSVEYEPSSKMTVLNIFLYSTYLFYLLLFGYAYCFVVMQIGSDPMVIFSLLMTFYISAYLV